MGWFDEQIEYRKKRERELLDDSFESIAKAITGRRIGISPLKEEEDVSDAVSALLKYMGVREKEVPAKISGLEDRLDFLLSSTGILYREVILTHGWHADAMGAMITSLKEEGTVIAVLPASMGGYEYTDPKTGATIRITAQEEKRINSEALCFYRPLPMRELTVKDLIRYMMSCLTSRDLINFAVAALAITLVGMISPKLNQILMGTVIAEQSFRLLYAVMSFLFFTTVGSILLSMIRALLLSRIRYKLNLNVSAATMMRILSLPASFFKAYSAGELNQYISYMDSLCATIVDSVFSTAVTGVFSLLYITQIFAFAPSLVLPSLAVTVLTLAVSLLSAWRQMKIDTEKMTHTAKERGLVFSLITGIQKIRLSGAENRAFAKWSELYTRSAEMTYNPPAVIRLAPVLTTAISLVGTAIMYYVAVKSRVSVADYYAFNTAYAYISSAFSALTSVALSAASIKPVIGLIRPLLEAHQSTE